MRRRPRASGEIDVRAVSFASGVALRAVEVRVVLAVPLARRERFWPSVVALAASCRRAMGAIAGSPAPLRRGRA